MVENVVDKTFTTKIKKIITNYGINFIFITIVILVIVYVTQLVIENMSFDEGKTIEYREATRTLPQNVGKIVENVLKNSNFASQSLSILQAEIIRRRFDGLIVIRPIGWYVYYTRGEKFYYLTSTFNVSGGGRVCSSNECNVMILEPTSSTAESCSSAYTQPNKFPHVACLSVTRLELLGVFAREPTWARQIVPLDDLLTTNSLPPLQLPRSPLDNDNSEKKKRITIVSVLNRLMDLQVL